MSLPTRSRWGTRTRHPINYDALCQHSWVAVLALWGALVAWGYYQ
jgi:hypothetical protein